jgi:small conductance mechanosensitive channel
VTPDLLFDFTFDTDHAAHDVLNASAHILVVFILVLIAISLTNRLITPLVRVAIREQMSNEPEVEVKKRIDTLTQVISRTIVLVVFVLAFVTVLPEFGVNAGPLIAGLGLVGLAVGFGSQNLVKDVINGMFILVENQYAVGDVVRVAGLNGQVEDMNLRRTVLRDQDGAVHFIPHSQITTATNLTKGFSRINLSVHVPYDTDIDKVFEIINSVGKELAEDEAFREKIEAAPHALRVEQTSGGSVEVSVRGDTAPMEQWAVAGEMRRRLIRAFDKEGIHAGTTSAAPPPPPPAVVASDPPIFPSSG